MKRPAQGFTLIEVLIAILVFGLGLLGVAALSATSQKVTTKAYHDMIASWQLHDMMELIKANPQHANDTTDYAHALGTGIPTDPACISTGCSTAQTATYDRYRWLTETADLLPQGVGQIVRTASGADISYTLSVHWDGRRNGATGTTCPPVQETDLLCAQISFDL